MGGVNLYGYAGNNPVSFDDPYGLCPVCAAAAAVAVGSAIGSVAYRAFRNHQAGRPLTSGLGTAALTGLRDGAVSAMVGMGMGAVAGKVASQTVSVVHFTSVEGAAAIESSGALRAGSFVTTPSQVAGATAAEAESLLEINAGKGAMQATFEVPAQALKTPFNGPTTSGGATQFQTTVPIPVEPGTFKPTP